MSLCERMSIEFFRFNVTARELVHCKSGTRNSALHSFSHNNPLSVSGYYNTFISYHSKLIITRPRIVQRYCSVVNNYFPPDAQANCNKHFPSYLYIFLPELGIPSNKHSSFHVEGLREDNCDKRIIRCNCYEICICLIFILVLVL